MPLYEYQCDACGGRIERIRKFSDPPLDEPCPSCGGHLTKLLSSPAIQFKGAGWYVTDYAKSGSSSAGSSSKSSDTKGETSEKKESPAASDKAESKSTSTDK